MTTMFANQDHIEQQWADKLSQLHRDREAAKQAGKSGSVLGSYTRKIKEVSSLLEKLRTVGVKHP